jgi:hypothetical protein
VGLSTHDHLYKPPTLCGLVLIFPIWDRGVTRKDLQEMGLRPKLHPYTAENEKMYMPPACHTMLNDDKTAFLKVLRDVRMHDSYALNISRCVRIKERMMSSLKSHDNHILVYKFNCTRQLHESIVVMWLCKCECRTHRESALSKTNFKVPKLIKSQPSSDFKHVACIK